MYPHYLSYFNEVAGGPSNGHRVLLDSNIDWGQDLLRVADYQREHPEEVADMKLAYFGSAHPPFYGIETQGLRSDYPFGQRPVLSGGTYVISVTQLMGVYFGTARPGFWEDEENWKLYRTLLALDLDPNSKNELGPSTTRKDSHRID